MMEDPAPTLSPRRLLLVEDETALGNLLARLLHRAGYAVTTAITGAQALASIEAGAQPFEAAVIDLTLPDMTGEAVLERLWAAFPTVPVVVCSGLARSESAFTVPPAATLRFLQKPFLPARLIETLAEILAAQSSSASTAS